MAYLALGEEFYKYNGSLYVDILKSLDKWVQVSHSKDEIVVIYFESDKFDS